MRVRDLIDEQFVVRLAKSGALILDVDDTLLARRGGSSESGETFADSEAARLLPDLAKCGIYVALVTGHGLGQLSQRLLDPLAIELTPVQSVSGFAGPVVYANRGAIRLEFVDGVFVRTAANGERFEIGEGNRRELAAIAKEIYPVGDKEPVLELRDGVILSMRPFSEEARRIAIGSGRQLLKEAGLDVSFEMIAAGKSTIEVSVCGLTKSVACTDLLASISRKRALPPEQVEAASLMIGDEFGEGGNDRVVADEFPLMTCISVTKAVSESPSKNVLEMSDLSGFPSTKAAAVILRQILETIG